jgi:hypothetical protein
MDVGNGIHRSPALVGQYLAWGVLEMSTCAAVSYYGMMGLIMICVSSIDGVIAFGGRITPAILPLVHIFGLD